MTKYEIGDRVHVVSVDEINGLSHLMPLGAEGVVTEISERGGYARVESGGQLWWVEDGHIELITTDPAPLRFENVRTGDQITVEGEDYSITGTASKSGNPECVTVGGVTVFNFDGDEGTHGPYGPPVRLTAHTRAPAEPEWHRAKVIKANVGSGRPTELLFWVEARRAWATADLLTWAKDAPTNVTIIVDEHGQVRSA